MHNGASIASLIVLRMCTATQLTDPGQGRENYAPHHHPSLLLAMPVLEKSQESSEGGGRVHCEHSDEAS